MFRTFCQSNKGTKLPPGITRYRSKDSRFPNAPVYVIFSALVKKPDGKFFIKKFSVIETRNENKARIAAQCYRMQYELSVKTGKEFNIEFLRNWRDESFFVLIALMKEIKHQMEEVK